jgi:hypothetical protein
MDLLDDFDRVRQTFAELSDVGKRLDSTLAEEPPVIQPAVAAYDLPSLSVEVTVRQASRWVPATVLLALLELAPCSTAAAATAHNSIAISTRLRNHAPACSVGTTGFGSTCHSLPVMSIASVLLCLHAAGVEGR